MKYPPRLVRRARARRQRRGHGSREGSAASALPGWAQSGGRSPTRQITPRSVSDSGRAAQASEPGSELADAAGHLHVRAAAGSPTHFRQVGNERAEGFRRLPEPSHAVNKNHPGQREPHNAIPMPPQATTTDYKYEISPWGLPWGLRVGNPPSNAGATSSIPSRGSKIPRAVGQLRSPWVLEAALPNKRERMCYIKEPAVKIINIKSKFPPCL